MVQFNFEIHGGIRREKWLSLLSFPLIVSIIKSVDAHVLVNDFLDDYVIVDIINKYSIECSSCYCMFSVQYESAWNGFDLLDESNH